MKTLFAAATALLLGAAPAQAVLIDFEDAPQGSVGSSYKTRGATFSAGRIIMADYFIGPDDILSRQLCPYQAPIGCKGDLTVSFDDPVTNLSLTVDGANAVSSIIWALVTFGDGSSDTIEFTDFRPFFTSTLSFAGLRSIASVKFSTNDGEGFSWDNFRFNEPNAVPEPASWAMMIGGFALAGGALRRKAFSKGKHEFHMA